MSGLHGKQVLVTRPGHQAENLCRLITEASGVAMRLPTIAIAPVDDVASIKAQLLHLDRYHWVFFVSANAVTMHMNYLDNGRMPTLKNVQCAAIGAATAKAMKSFGLPVDVMPEEGFSSEALLALAPLQAANITNKTCLIVRGEGGHEELANTLIARGAQVEYLNVYKRIIPDVDCTQLMQSLKHDCLHAITITSGEALRNLLTLLSSDCHQKLFTIPLIVVSERIKQIAKELGCEHIIVAASPSDTAIFQAVKKVFNGGIAWQK
ncbi:MAG: uroporphyrinogen-III synthase [Methylovulum sp.]|jgi:uroporphyrinogen-III synthase